MKSLKEKIELVMFNNGQSNKEVEQEVPLTEHQQLLQKLDEIKNDKMSPGEKELRAKEDLKEGIEKLLGY